MAANSPWRTGALERIGRRYDAYLAQGFPTGDFEAQPGPETLQCRNADDKTNWLGLLAKCDVLIGAGFGDAPIDPPIRCTSNREYAESYTDARLRMLNLLDSYGVALKNVWRLKDLVRDAETRADLDTIDLDEGWP